MKKKQLNYNVDFKVALVYKIIAAVVFFAVFANIVDLRAFYRGSAVELNIALLQTGAELSKISSKINAVKTSGDLFKFKSGKTDGNNRSDISPNDDKIAVITKQSKKFSAELSKKNIFVPVKELKTINIVQFIDTGQTGPPGHLFFYYGFIMVLLLILLLMSVLPRGIPLKNNNKNRVFMRPVFI